MQFSRSIKTFYSYPIPYRISMNKRHLIPSQMICGANIRNIALRKRGLRLRFSASSNSFFHSLLSKKIKTKLQLFVYVTFIRRHAPTAQTNNVQSSAHSELLLFLFQSKQQDVILRRLYVHLFHTVLVRHRAPLIRLVADNV